MDIHGAEEYRYISLAGFFSLLWKLVIQKWGGKEKKKKKAGNSKRASKHHQEPLLFNCRCDHER